VVLLQLVVEVATQCMEGYSTGSRVEH